MGNGRRLALSHISLDFSEFTPYSFATGCCAKSCGMNVDLAEDSV